MRWKLKPGFRQGICLLKLEFGEKTVNVSVDEDGIFDCEPPRSFPLYVWARRVVDKPA